MPEFKTCRRCDKDKAIGLFSKGLPTCKMCEIETQKEQTLEKTRTKSEKAAEKEKRGEKIRQDLLDPTKRLQPGEPRPDIDAMLRRRYYGK